MKKLFLFLLVLPLAFTACSDDDDASIVGKWVYSHAFAVAETKNDTDNLVKKAVEANYADEAGDDYYYIEFKADGTYTTNDDDAGTYVLEGNQLTSIHNGGAARTYTILLTSNTLSISIDATEKAQYSYEDGYLDQNLEEGESFAEDATIEKVISTEVWIKK